MYDSLQAIPVISSGPSSVGSLSPFMQVRHAYSVNDTESTADRSERAGELLRTNDAYLRDE